MCLEELPPTPLLPSNVNPLWFNSRCAGRGRWRRQRRGAQRLGGDGVGSARGARLGLARGHTPLRADEHALAQRLDGGAGQSCEPARARRQRGQGRQGEAGLVGAGGGGGDGGDSPRERIAEQAAEQGVTPLDLGRLHAAQRLRRRSAADAALSAGCQGEARRARRRCAADAARAQWAQPALAQAQGLRPER
eukprot:3703378-Pleurochrysis_carterae.AAC.1